MVKIYEDLDLNGHAISDSVAGKFDFDLDLDMKGNDILDIDRLEGGAGYIDLDAANDNIRINPNVSGILYISGDVEVTGDLDVDGEIYSLTNVYAEGDIAAGGDIIGDNKYFRIDHPLYPDTKYLFHCSVEGPERRTIYYGRATTFNGKATVYLPEWWEALNGSNKEEFNYQLTSVGKKNDCYISKEIENNSFEISSDTDGTICWQITAIRHDTSSENKPFEVETNKE